MNANPGLELRAVIKRIFPILKEMNEHSARQKSTQDKWSAKEIIGHLIDSASNNHQRIVCAALIDEFVFTGNAQDEWVALQKYNDGSWSELLKLWFLYNLHLARVMKNTEPNIVTKPRLKHNLHQIA